MFYGLGLLVTNVMLLWSPEIYEKTGALTEALNAGGFVKLPMGFQIARDFIGSLIGVVAGVFLWRGYNWARWLAVAWMVLSLGMHFLLAGPVIAVYMQIPVFLVVTYFLTTRRASAFLAV